VAHWNFRRVERGTRLIATRNRNRRRWRDAVRDPSSPRALPLASVRMTQESKRGHRAAVQDVVCADDEACSI
jgi:hypothetical protein